MSQYYEQQKFNSYSQVFDNFVSSTSFVQAISALAHTVKPLMTADWCNGFKRVSDCRFALEHARKCDTNKIKTLN